MQLSLTRSFVVIPSSNTYRVSHWSGAILILRPFSVLTKGLLASFVVTSSPFGSTMVVVICACNICSAAMEPTARLVERVPT